MKNHIMCFVVLFQLSTCQILQTQGSWKWNPLLREPGSGTHRLNAHDDHKDRHDGVTWCTDPRVHNALGRSNRRWDPEQRNHYAVCWSCPLLLLPLPVSKGILTTKCGRSRLSVPTPTVRYTHGLVFACPLLSSIPPSLPPAHTGDRRPGVPSRLLLSVSDMHSHRLCH